MIFPKGFELKKFFGQGPTLQLNRIIKKNNAQEQGHVKLAFSVGATFNLHRFLSQNETLYTCVSISVPVKSFYLFSLAGELLIWPPDKNETQFDWVLGGSQRLSASVRSSYFSQDCRNKEPSGRCCRTLLLYNTRTHSSFRDDEMLTFAHLALLV